MSLVGVVGYEFTNPLDRFYLPPEDVASKINYLASLQESRGRPVDENLIDITQRVDDYDQRKLLRLTHHKDPPEPIVHAYNIFDDDAARMLRLIGSDISLMPLDISNDLRNDLERLVEATLVMHDELTKRREPWGIDYTHLSARYKQVKRRIKNEEKEGGALATFVLMLSQSIVMPRLLRYMERHSIRYDNVAPDQWFVEMGIDLSFVDVPDEQLVAANEFILYSPQPNLPVEAAR